MNAFDYYLHCWRNYATFSGRARRSEFWFFALFNFLISMGLSIIGMVLNYVTGVEIFGIFSSLYSLAVFIPNMAVAVRRLHDTNRSGWWVLGYYLPGVFMLFFVIMAMVQIMSKYSFYALDHISPEDLPWGAITGMGISMLVGLVFFIILLIWMCTDSEPGVNRFGPNPKEVVQNPGAFQQPPYGGYQQPNAYQQPAPPTGNPYQQNPNAGGQYQQ